MRKKPFKEEVELIVSNIQKTAWDNTAPIAQRTTENNYLKEKRN